MNSPQRITRHLVKAVSAGALVLAAALPMAVASSAGAADVPVTGAWLADGSVTTTLNPSTAVTTSSTSIALVSTASYTVPAGDLLFDSTTNTPLGVASAQAVSATTSPYGATVTLNAASLAAAATTDTIVLYKPMAIGTGGSGTMYVSGSGFANNGSTVTISSSAPGLTFTSASEKSSTWATASYASTSATVAGSYTVAITDGNGTSATPLAGAITVNAAPTYTSLSVTSLTTGSVAATDVITGTGFVTGATATFTSTVDGTTLASTDSSTGAFTSGKVSTGTQGGTTFTSSTSLSVKVSPTNSVTGSAATPGTYTVTITNPDGGTVTSAAAFTVTSYGVTNLSPSAIPVPTSGSTNTVVTVNGSGFQYGASVALSGGTDCGTTGKATIVANSTTVTATTAITTTVNVPTGTGLQDCTVTVSNPSVSNGGNGATYALPGALGIGQASTVAATITGATPNTPIVPGAATSVLTLTGTGFSQYSTAAAYTGTSTSAAANVTINNCGGNSGTSLICYVTVSTGALSGADNVVVTNTSAKSNGFAGAINVAGPVITSQTPAAIAVGAPIGTVITLNGTGFTNTTSGTVTAGTSGLAGIVSYSSPTAMTLVITTSPTAASTTASPTTVTLTQTVAGSTTAVSSPFSLTVNAAPVVNSAVTYKVGTGVGVGATAQTVYINGQNFSAGSTVGTFVNANGVADTHVTATVTNVTANQITATVAITAGDTNIAVGYTVKSTDGGSAIVSAIAYPIIINAGPTITSVTPATATAGSTTAFTVVGTGFATGAVVSLTANGTCGTTTVVSATTVTASCTLGAAGATASYLTVSNTDGGTATSATAVLAAAAPKPPTPVVNLHTTGAHGFAVVGKTVTITITGGGFYGQPTLTSTAPGVKAIVVKDNGKMLTVRVTVRAGAARGWHTFTIRLANGKMAKVNYLTK